MLSQLKKAVVVAGVALSAASAQAAVIEYSSGFASNNTSNYSTTTGRTFGDSSVERTNINLSRFDSSLGTLTGVQISFTSNWDHYSSASAYDSSAQSTRHTRNYSCGTFGWSTCTRSYYTYSNDTYVSSNSNATFTVSLDDPHQTTRTDYDSNYDSCGRSYSNSSSSSSVSCNDRTNDTNNSFDGVLDLSSFDLSEFIGDDDLDLSFTNSATFNANCDNNDAGDRCTAYNDSYWRGTVTVAYTYDVPEPGTLSILALGLMGLGLARKRQK